MVKMSSFQLDTDFTVNANGRRATCCHQTHKNIPQTLTYWGAGREGERHR